MSLSYDSGHIENFASSHMTGHIGHMTEQINTITSNPFIAINIDQEISNWLEWISKKYSKKTYQRCMMYHNYIYYIKDPVKLSLELGKLTPAKRTHIQKTLSSFAKYLDLKHGSIDVYTSFIRRIFKASGFDWDWHSENISVLENNEILSEDDVVEIIRILKEQSNTLGLKAWFMVETGLRTGEVDSLDWKNIDLDSGIVIIDKIRNTKRAFFSVITDRLKDILKKHREVKFGRPFTTYSMTLHNAEVKVRERFNNFRWYLFRKFNASFLLSRGVPEPIVDMLQGRSPPKESLVIRESYIRLSFEQIRRMHNEAFKDLSERIYLLFEE